MGARDARGRFRGRQPDGANLPLSNLSDVNLVGASLRGAKLGNANLSGANMCGARLDPAPGTAAALSAGGADLSGAFMPNVNLNGADLSSAILTNASFFGTYKRSCAPANCGSTKAIECAGAAGATLAGTSFAGAYLAKTDFGGATKYPDFSNAILIGATFDSAVFTTDENGKGVVFSGALLMGATFDNAVYPNAVFTGASTDTKAGCWRPVLSPAHTAFRGYAQPDAGNTKCRAAAAAPICVLVAYTGPTALPFDIPLSAPVASAIGSACSAGSGVCVASAAPVPRSSPT
ncbi:pentapeptide repeat-containing protein [Ramlibacter terrae]|uniref:Pentapeptide repeat-containing protein n=1 Tax=Ramlibacter terrae TaxID=2732511 RepID=A0ABX6P700_9BURK|nr:pentapeptide repeat-containing protein [Ramlibacter terrae]